HNRTSANLLRSDRPFTAGGFGFFDLCEESQQLLLMCGASHRLAEEPRINPALPHLWKGNFLEGAMTRKTLAAMIQRYRSLCQQLIKGRGKIEEHLNRHEYTLSSEVRLELERRCEGQYGD